MNRERFPKGVQSGISDWDYSDGFCILVNNCMVLETFETEGEAITYYERNLISRKYASADIYPSRIFGGSKRHVLVELERLQHE